MKSYVKPTIVVNEDLAEGVFMASGAVESSNVNHAHVSITSQTQFDSRFNAYWNTIDWRFDAEHTHGGMILTMKYDQAVTYHDTGTPFIKVKTQGSNELVLDVNLKGYESCQGCSITVDCAVQPTLLEVSGQCYEG